MMIKNYSQMWKLNIRFFYLLSLPSPTMLLSSFNPFSITKVEQYSSKGRKIQEIIDYAESRFRAVLTKLFDDLAKTEINQNIWAQTLLNRELVSILDDIYQQ